MRSFTLRAAFFALLPLGLGCRDDHDGSLLGPIDLSGLDPGFETYTGGDNLFIFESGYTARIVANNAVVHGGATSVQFQDVESQEIRFPSHLHPDKIRLSVGGVYVFEGWFHGIDVGGGGSVSDVPIAINAVFYNGSTFVGATAATPSNLSAFSAWEKLSFSFTVPAGVDRCYISIAATAAVGVNVDLFIDDLSLERTG